MKKLKVVWICHFTNAEMQSHLPVWKQKDEFAPWIPNIIKGFEQNSELELHVIAPHDYLKSATSFLLRNIHYHFIPFGIPIINRHWPRNFRPDILTNFFYFRKKVSDIVNQIKPDIINLMGAENSYYSSSILEFKNNYPILILIQGFVSEFNDQKKKSLELKSRIKIEELLLQSFNNFCGEQDSSAYIAKYNPTHRFFRLYFPVNEELIQSLGPKEKKYDCIYFGRLEWSKGADDFIKIVSLIAAKKSTVKACLAGSGDIEYYKSLAVKLECFENIDFVGFTKSQAELFDYVKSSRVFLAPPYKDRLSSTIRESMLLRVPVIAYATGGIPYINEFDENIILVKTGDYQCMAEQTLKLLNDEENAKSLAEKGYQYCMNEFGLEVNARRFLDSYNCILKEERNNQ